MKLTYKHTLISCFVCFAIQSIVNNFSPLLFVVFSDSFNISIDQIAFLVSFNFIVQMGIDILGSRYADLIGYRRGLIFAHIFSFAGVFGLGVLPDIMHPYAGLLLATTLCAIGSGFIEVLSSPVVEALPTEEKSSSMSLLHSFYCWGHIAIVLLSTLFFNLFGIENWRYLAFLWSLVPLFNTIAFFFVPIINYSEGRQVEPVSKLFKMRDFQLLLILMICAGAGEQAIVQWSSLFAEKGLGIDKTVGDILGPCMFGFLMALSRTLYGRFGAKMKLRRSLTFGAAGIILGYLITVFSPIPILSLIGCGIVGFSVGTAWPGTISLATSTIKSGGTSMFAILALAGDIGCASGPGLVGLVSGRVGGEKALNIGILASIIFPVVALAVLLFWKWRNTERIQND